MDKRTARGLYVAVVQSVLIFGSETWVLTPGCRNPSRGFTTKRRGGWQVRHQNTVQGRAINYNLSYHEIVSGVRAEAGNAPIQEMVGASHPGYPGDKGGECSRIRGGGGVEAEEFEAER